jgi:hypothetical protein
MATTLFRGPILHGKFNEAGVTGFNIEDKAANYSVVVGDSGKTFTSKTDGVVFTLPAISIGRVITFVNTAQDGANALTISPNANDGILYAGSLTDNKDVINEKRIKYCLDNKDVINEKMKKYDTFYLKFEFLGHCLELSEHLLPDEAHGMQILRPKSFSVRNLQ